MTTENNTPVTTLCKSCREPIKFGAKKCVHCEAFQDWRGSLHLSSTLLALLVALVSVISLAVPVLKETFSPNNSQLVVALQHDSPTVLTLLVSNTGTKPGGIGGNFIIDIKHTVGKARYWLSLISNPPPFVRPGDAVQVSLGPGNNYNYITRLFNPNTGPISPRGIDLPEFLEECQCTLSFNVVNYDGSIERRELEDNCSVYYEILLEALIRSSKEKLGG